MSVLGLQTRALLSQLTYQGRHRRDWTKTGGRTDPEDPGGHCGRRSRSQWAGKG